MTNTKSVEATVEKKSHRERHSGRKAQKKKEKKNSNRLEDVSDKQRNPKAFAFNSAVRAERRFRRKEDINTKKQHIPLIDRTPLEPPPILVAVVGPPKVGKSTVINNLIKLFTKSPLVEIKGPVTVVIGRKRRITFIECNNDINSMIDLAKIADLVLLLCDASFGFEMEVFEFLNICQVHGMPKIMGILTHLDMIKNAKTLKNTKKVLKHRFWTEVYQGAKLFYLSGIIHDEYLRNEIKNLGRFISVMKFRPLTWRTTHGYLLADRYEDLTNQELIRKNPNCDRSISLYGYVRGVPIKKETYVHIAGMGDVKIHDMSFLPDPCPLPEQIKKRALVEKEKLIYAPFSGVGGIVYDKDAVYVDLGGSHSHKRRSEDDETDNIVTNLIDSKKTLDVKMAHSKIQIFSDGKELTAQEFEENEESDDGSEENNERPLPGKKKSEEDEDLEGELKKLRGKFGSFKEERVEDSGRVRRKVIFEDGDEELSKTLGEESDDEDKNEESEDDEVESSEDEESSEESESFEEIELHSPERPQEVNEDSKIRSDDKKKQKQSKEKTGKKMEETLKEGRSGDVHSKVSDILKKLEETKKQKDEEMPVDEDVDADDGDEDGEEIEMEEDEDEEEPEDEDSDEEIDDGVKWKENLAEKAQNAFLERQSATQNLMKLVYGVFDVKSQQQKEDPKPEEEEENEEDAIGGLFRKASQTQQKLKLDRDTMDLTESSLMLPWNAPTKNWLEDQNKILIANCFVTGKWKDTEDADELLKLNEAGDLSDSEMFGDFEDFETGEKHVSEKRKRNEDEEAVLAEKKRKLKEKFDAEYDNSEKNTYYDELKQNAEQQAQLNKTVFENMADDVRVQIEGFRPGMYVRVEVQGVPAEFVTNFDATYPLLVGALNMGEENIGYVNVKIKKHRWFKKILKTNDPLIISLGWRRFQTIPLYSKLEDDMKFRYLKYTPEHLACNAHFWGPITPQGSGFLALQSIESNPDVLKRQGFRIAATGVVQELDKSTQIMKKLKLVGYPLKIYKKTAFIKGMFNSALEVAKFEGARIKTVSGVRGQIKKAVNKPEGCFRATFEDKILLSDIVFCRTWYKVDVPQFYNPVTTLLLPQDKKNLWRGVRTTGEIKREKGIQHLPNQDSLYKPIERNPKPFRPLVIPSKLQKALPYRDKPKHGVKPEDRKKGINRVAVIREPYEQKVSGLMKMVKTNYEYKQEKLKNEMKERMEKHRQVVEAQEGMKERKLKQKKKEVCRIKSKAQKNKK